MKKLFNLGFIALTSLALASCTPQASSSGNGNSDNGTQLSSEESLKLQTVTAMSHINDIKPSQKVLRGHEDHVITPEEKESIRSILPNLEILMDDGGIQTDSKVEKVNIQNGSITYDTKESYSFDNMTYILLYKDTTNDNVNDGYDNFFSQGWNDKNNVSRISGLAFADDNAFNADGTVDLTQGVPFRSFEKEKERTNHGQVKKEVERTLRIAADANSYIQVEEEHETSAKGETHEFSYKIRENRKEILDYSIELESEKGETKISYEMNDIEYEMQRKSNKQESVYKVEYENEAGDNDTEATLYFVKKIDSNIFEDSTKQYWKDFIESK